MGIDTTFKLEFRHDKKSYLEGVQKYFRVKSKDPSFNKYGFEEITKRDKRYLLLVECFVCTDPESTGVTGEGGELANLLEKFPELEIEGTYEDDYGHGTVSGSDLNEDSYVCTEDSDEDEDEDEEEDEDSSNDEDGNDSDEPEEEDQNDKPLSSRQDSKKIIKGYRFTKGFNVNAINYEKELNLEMVLIPAGTFMMGSPESEEGRYLNETQHEVTITKPFYLGKFTITQEQWNLVMGNNPSGWSLPTQEEWKLVMRNNPSGWSLPKGDQLPMTYLSWVDCQEFIKKLNASTKGGYRLPTESEWEYACRAGTTTMYSFGDEITPKNANYDDSDKEKLGTGGSYKPNAFGLYDMHGNVWEWCEEWFEDYPTGAVTDPQGPHTGESRILRGGSFDFIGSFARSAMRSNLTQGGRIQGSSFRLARTI